MARCLQESRKLDGLRQHIKVFAGRRYVVSTLIQGSHNERAFTGSRYIMSMLMGCSRDVDVRCQGMERVGEQDIPRYGGRTRALCLKSEMKQHPDKNMNIPVLNGHPSVHTKCTSIRSAYIPPLESSLHRDAVL